MQGRLHQGYPDRVPHWRTDWHADTAEEYYNHGYYLHNYDCVPGHLHYQWRDQDDRNHQHDYGDMQLRQVLQPPSRSNHIHSGNDHFRAHLLPNLPGDGDQDFFRPAQHSGY